MPLPEPQEDQTQEEFMEVCMLNEAAIDEFPDEDQRLAVCQAQWENKDEEEVVEDEPVDEVDDEPVEDEEEFVGKMSGTVEKRFSKSKDIKADGRTLTGYAVMYDTLSVDMGDWQERIKPGAFDKWMSRENVDIYAISQHEYTQPLARTSKKTLELNSDETGLAFKLELPNTTYANDLIASIEHGDIEGMSFGMIPMEERWTKEDGMDIREISEAILDHISPVTTPAYEETTVSVRAHKGYRKFKEQEEEKTPLLDMATLQQRQKEAELKP